MRKVHVVDFLIATLLMGSGIFGICSGVVQAERAGCLFVLLSSLLLSISLISAKNPQALYSRLRPLATVGIVFFLYSALGLFGMSVAQGETFDSELNAVDMSLLGFDLSNRLQFWISSEFLNVLAFCYAFFIPYIHLSLFFTLESRSGDEQNAFLTSWTLLYVLSYLGYVFLPSQGPGAFPEIHHHEPLPGGYFVTLTVDGVQATGGLFGAFPSLHVGASVFLCWADRSRDRLRALVSLPIVLGIYAATLALRYHYVIDLLVGTGLAFLCHPLGRALWRWQRSGRCIS